MSPLATRPSSSTLSEYPFTSSWSDCRRNVHHAVIKKVQESKLVWQYLMLLQEFDSSFFITAIVLGGCKACPIIHPHISFSNFLIILFTYVISNKNKWLKQYNQSIHALSQSQNALHKLLTRLKNVITFCTAWESASFWVLLAAKSFNSLHSDWSSNSFCSTSSLAKCSAATIPSPFILTLSMLDSWLDISFKRIWIKQEEIRKIENEKCWSQYKLLFLCTNLMFLLQVLDFLQAFSMVIWIGQWPMLFDPMQLIFTVMEEVLQLQRLL